MTHSAVGGMGAVAEIESPLLAHDWYKELTPAQLAAYVRYQFIYLNEKIVDWDAHEHVRRRPHWDGGKDAYGVKHTSAWGKAIRAIRDAGADPGIWVRAHFSPEAELKMTQARALPEIRPTMLYASNSPAIYSRYCAQLPSSIETEFDIAGYTIASRMQSAKAFGFSKDDQNLYVLCDESYVSASPFFRHAFAALGNCDRAVERYLWFAAIEYEAQQRAYDCAIDRVKDQNYDWWITDTLRAAVREIRQHWRNYHG
jgi:hypothetical protein